MFVYDSREHKLLHISSIKLVDSDSSGRKGVAIEFTSPDGNSLLRKCRSYYEATEYMDEVASAADAGATLILVDNA